ncbi:hypothetical protein GSUET_04600 [Geobacter sulfurreducens subsp. ethanolicus]|uniref:hypothetical protein n=1 Tax=Geobacter sulfurreducens TaxID=35554 RepID=UPI002573889B|nr:hypothetical protein [Geobacter sulfurreducens]BEH08848.1 hypothetical protein GSUET_04600 [Geobacter sulfurreducens subsp. ethanolicus]
MKRKAAIKKFKPLSQKVLKRLAEDRIIEFPLTESNQLLISALCRIWTDEWYVAQMNKTFKPDKRAVMLAFPNFGKIERYILSSYLNLKPGAKLSVREMASRIQQHFEVEYPQFKIHRVRQAAYNLRRHSRTGSRKHTLIQMAMLEGNHDNFWS